MQLILLTASSVWLTNCITSRRPLSRLMFVRFPLALIWCIYGYLLQCVLVSQFNNHINCTLHDRSDWRYEDVLKIALQHWQSDIICLTDYSVTLIISLFQCCDVIFNTSECLTDSSVRFLCLYNFMVSRKVKCLSSQTQMAMLEHKYDW